MFLVRGDGNFFYVFALIFVAATGTTCGRKPLRPTPEALERAAPEVDQQLRADVFAYFRFVNRAWSERVCAEFSADLPDLLVVRLHGDAHVEQFAVTNDAWGGDAAIANVVKDLGQSTTWERFK